MQLASGCMWIWFVDSIPALVGFLRALRFPPSPKIGILSYFWSTVSDLSLCVYSLLVCLRLNYLCVRCGCHTAAPCEPSGLICRALQKLLIKKRRNWKIEPQITISFKNGFVSAIMCFFFFSFSFFFFFFLYISFLLLQKELGKLIFKTVITKEFIIKKNPKLFIAIMYKERKPLQSAISVFLF